MIWAKEETLPREEIERIQLTKLKDTVRYIYDRVKPYREKMDMAGVRPEDIQTLEDLKKLPFTYKADFRLRRTAGAHFEKSDAQSECAEERKAAGGRTHASAGSAFLSMSA